MEKLTKFNISLAILILFHVIGVFIFKFNPSAVSLSYLTILLCGIIVFLGEENKRKALIAYTIIFIVGYLIEYIGVTTGLLFGAYSYGNSIGYKLMGIPLIMGVNWIAIVVSSVSVIKKIGLSNNTFVIAFLSALLCTLMDFIIEPVAIKFDFWSWEEITIPISNYVDWFIFSLIFAYIYTALKLSTNKIAVFLFFIWIAFFSIIKLLE
ncbi:MAG: carotenoid biosynthesis protein [Crocinitomicaceae bacterium]|nr:carotenoid biosynthesis protein [Crocinitomicaceae bacterium]